MQILSRFHGLALAALLCSAAAHAAAHAANPLTIDKAAIATPALTEQSMAALAQRGVATVSVDAWQDGYPQFASRVAQAALGVERDPALAAQGQRDLVEETLIQAARHGLNYVAWFGGAVPLAPDHPVRRLHPDWLARDASGAELQADGSAWLDPLVPGARQFMLDLMTEAVQRHDLDGIRIDQSLLLAPVALARDAAAVALYTSETGKAAPASEDDPAWQAWRRAKATAQAAAYTTALQARYPRLFVATQAAAEAEFPAGWRAYAQVLRPSPSRHSPDMRWSVIGLNHGRFRVVAFDGHDWEYVRDFELPIASGYNARTVLMLPFRYSRAEIVVDRRRELRRPAKGENKAG